MGLWDAGWGWCEKNPTFLCVGWYKKSHIWVDYKMPQSKVISSTRLMWVLKRKFFFSTYVEMYHTSTILWWPVATHFSASISPLTSCFPLTMAISGFGLYHCLWPDDAPAECAGITPTPWVMMPTLGFVSYDRGHELLVPPPNNAFVSFVF